MQINITGKGVDLTDAIKNYVDKKIGRLEKFYDQIIRAVITVGVENHHHQKGEIFFAEGKLEIPGNDIFVSETAASLYGAIDALKNRLESDLKKHKVKLREKAKIARKILREKKEYQIQ